MIKRCASAIVVVLALAAAPAPIRAAPLASGQDASQQPTAAQLALVELIKASDAARAAGDIATSEARLQAAIAHPAFPELSAPIRAQVLAMAARHAADRQDLPAAFALARRATDTDPANFDHWQLRLLIAPHLGEHEDGAGSALQAYRLSPAKATEQHELILQAVALAPFDSPARYELLQALFAGVFELPSIGSPDTLWHELALQHLARGDEANARTVAARITHPTVLATLLADRRFDAVRDPRIGTATLRALAQQRVADLRSRASRDPTSLRVRRELASALLVAGDHEGVIALANEVERSIAGNAGGGAAYRDIDPHLGGFIGLAGTAFERLGRADDALARYRRAAGSFQSGNPDPAQALNLAHKLVDTGRPQEARELLAPLEQSGLLNPYGRMILAHARVRTAQALGDQAGVDAAMAYLREHRDQASNVFVQALFDLGEMDAAAEAFISRLDDPATRSDALYATHVFPVVGALRADAQSERERWQALLAREDVAAAIERHGRRLELPIYRTW